jgi:hypothetical protein
VTKTEHAEYLQTDHWRNLRKRFLADHDHCERCEMPRWLAAIAYDQDLHVHHKSYANRGNEWEICDLEALCRRCHDVESFGRSDLREVKYSRCSLCGDKHWDRRADRCAYCARMLNEGAFGLEKFLDCDLNTNTWMTDKTLREQLLTWLPALLGNAFIVRHLDRFLYVMKLCDTIEECDREAASLIAGGVRDTSGPDERLDEEVAKQTRRGVPGA